MTSDRIATEDHVDEVIAALEAGLTLDGSKITSGTIDDARIPAAVARDSEVTSAVAAEATARNTAITTAIANLIASAPGLLDTLAEIAAALGNDPNFATTITTLITTKVAKSLYDANTILTANADDTPAPLTIGEQTILGRLTGGNIAALTPTQIRTLLSLVVGTDVQAFNTNLQTIAALDSTTAGALVTDGAGWIRKTYAQLKTALTLVKGDVGLSNVDNTSDANKPVSTATQTALDLKASITYVDGLIAASDAVVYKGVIDASGNPNYPAASAGHLYRISVAGKIGGASGVNVEVGDTILCLTDGTSSGTQAAVGANWNVIQVNVDGSVVGPASATADHYATYNGTTGKIIKDSGIAVGDATKLQGFAVDGTAPATNGKIWIWDQDATTWVAKALSGDATLTKAGVLTLVGTANFESLVRAQSLDQMAPPAANLPFNSKRGTGVADPVNPQDIMTLAYSDAHYQPLSAALTALAAGGGWLADTNTWTRTGNLTFTVGVDATAWLTIGTKIRCVDSGATTRYGVIATSVFSAGTTTVTLITNDDHPLASGALTSPRYSYGAAPVGWPAGFNWTPTSIVGWSPNPGSMIWRWQSVGRVMTIWIAHTTNGTSAAVAHTATLPVTSSGVAAYNTACRCVDNNTAQLGQLSISAAAPTIVNMAGIFSTANNTASGNSRVVGGSISYEF